MSARDITAVIFDCDGVLVDSEVLSLELEREMLAEAGLHYEVEDYKRRFLGLPYSSYIEIVGAEALQKTGRPLPEDFGTQFSARLRALFEARLTALPGANAFVGALALPKAVASSSMTRSLHWKLEKTGLKSHFGAHIYSTEHVKRGKPEPDLFLHAARWLGADPSTTLVLEDSINGIKAARAAGMIAAGFTGGGHCDEGHGDLLKDAGAHHVFNSFAQFGTILVR